MVKNIAAGTGNTLVGQVRYNGSSQTKEVYDGMTRLTLPTAYPTVDLAPHVQAVVVWAQGKMAEEARLKELAKQHPSVREALDVLHRAQEQLEIVAALVTV